MCSSCGAFQPATVNPPEPAPTAPSDRARTRPRNEQAPPTLPTWPTTHRPTPARRRSGRARTVAVVALIAALAAAAAYGFLADRDDSGDASGDRAELVRGFCANPRPLADEGDLAAFEPGTGAVAYAQLPQPASSTDPDGSRVLQVSPVVGRPNLTLDASIGLVSLAVCVEETMSTPSAGSCEFRVTTVGALGEEAEADLAETSFDARIYELRTARVLARGTITTPVDRCPPFAFVDADTVSNSLTDELITAWIGQELPGGVPR